MGVCAVCFLLQNIYVQTRTIHWEHKKLAAKLTPSGIHIHMNISCKRKLLLTPIPSLGERGLKFFSRISVYVCIDVFTAYVFLVVCFLGKVEP